MTPNKKYAPRRSQTFSPSDMSRNGQPTPSSTLPRIAENQSREASVSRTVVDGTGARIRDVILTTSTNPEPPKNNSSPLKSTSKLAAHRSMTEIREPYLPAEHTHVMTKTLLVFAQKCSICLDDVPGLNYVDKCTGTIRSKKFFRILLFSRKKSTFFKRNMYFFQKKNVLFSRKKSILSRKKRTFF